MTTEFINQSLKEKISIDENFIRYSYYELRVKNNLSENDVDKFLKKSRDYLEDIGYRVYFTNAKFVYKNANRTVQPNELMIAIKE